MNKLFGIKTWKKIFLHLENPNKELLYCNKSNKTFKDKEE